MATVRFWQPADVPYLLHMAAETAWQITPEKDRAYTRPEIVRRAAQANLAGCLSTPGGTVLVAEADGRPVGYLLITIQPNDRTGQLQGYLADIYVEPEYRRAKLGLQLHQMAEAYVHRLGIRTVTNWVHTGNEKGLKAAEHFGMRPWAVMMSKELRE
jgi:GNAT superfamily N-acetyltransferase